MSESDNVRAQKKKRNLKKMKSQIKKKKKPQKNEISKKVKSKTFRTQSMSVSDNRRI